MGEILSKLRNVKIIFKGGIGNQLFQYAFYKFLLSIMNFKVDFNFEKLNNKSELYKKITPRSFVLNEFIKNKINFYNHDSFSFKNFFIFKNEKIISFFLKKKIKLPLNHYEGYWQDIFFAKYLKKEDFKNNFFLKPAYMPDNYYIIHYRGGDFFHSKDHIVLNYEYYLDNVNKYRDLPIFALSDDLINLRKILSKIDPKIEPIECNYIDAFNIIYNSKGGITSNSTFSWWPIFLSKNNNWVFPKKWLRNKNIYQANLFIPGTQTG